MSQICSVKIWFGVYIDNSACAMMCISSLLLANSYVGEDEAAVSQAVSAK